MNKYIKVNWILFKNAWIRDAKIPGVVLPSIFFELLEITISVVFFNLIFANTKELGGWNFYQVLVLYSFAKMINSIHGGWFKRGVQSISTDMIRMGDLDFYLTKPIDAMFLVSASKPRIYTFLNVAFSLSLAVYAIAKGGIHIGAVNLIWFIVLAVFALVLFYCLSVITVTPAFWFTRLWSLQSLLGRLNQFMRYPATIFSPILRTLLFVLLPIMAISYIPVTILFGNPSWYLIPYLMTITVIFVIITKSFWNLGLKKYGSASS
jgi:ABC-2 type transport system permease protein